MTVAELIRKLEGMDRSLEVTVTVDVPGDEIAVDTVRIIDSDFSWKDQVVEISV